MTNAPRQLRHRLAILLGLLLLAAGPARAQPAPDSARLAIKVALTSLAVNTYKVELEYRRNQRFSFTLAPQVIAGTVPVLIARKANETADQVRGFGLSAGSRLYISHTATDGGALTGLYVGLQAEYWHLSLGYQQESWGEDLAADGLRYYVFRLRDYGETINRYGGAASLGYQCELSHLRLRLDCSLSLDALHSPSSAGAASRYRSSYIDYGYSGLSWSVGLALGYVLK